MYLKKENFSILTARIYSQGKITLGTDFLKEHDLKEGDEFVLVISKVLKDDEFAELLLDTIEERKMKMPKKTKKKLQAIAKKKK